MLEKLICRWYDNNKQDLRKVRGCGRDWTDSGQGPIVRVFVNIEMMHEVPSQQDGSCINFSRQTLHHGVACCA